MIQAVIFDLDGVLVSTDELHYRAWKAMADRENIYFDRDINQRLRGVSRMESLEIILERSQKVYSPEEKEVLAAFKNGLYVQLLDDLTEQDRLPSVTQTLQHLRSRSMLLAVGSSSKNAKKILEKTGLTDFFDAIADGTDIVRSKPDPEVFLCAAKKLGVSPAVCAVVEDARAGIEAAKAGGMLACVLGDARESELADVCMESLAELPEQLERN